MKNINIRSYHQNGGFLFSENPAFPGTPYTPAEAIQVFLDNLTDARILTDSSISCITVRLTASRTPYIHTRAQFVGQPMNTILIKFMPRTHADVVEYRVIPDVRRERFELNTEFNILKEATIQLDIYNRSITSEENAYDPFVPAILAVVTGVSGPAIRTIYERIINRRIFTERSSESPPNRDRNILTAFLIDSGLEFGIVAMEFMEGFQPLSNLLRAQSMGAPGVDEALIYKFKNYLLYEFVKLLHLGYVHIDSHPGNVMVSPTSLYFTSDASSEFTGRALIIDFGRIYTVDELSTMYPGEFDGAMAYEEPLSTAYFYNKLRSLRPLDWLLPDTWHRNALGFMGIDMLYFPSDFSTPFTVDPDILDIHRRFREIYRTLSQGRLALSRMFVAEYAVICWMRGLTIPTLMDFRFIGLQSIYGPDRGRIMTAPTTGAPPTTGGPVIGGSNNKEGNEIYYSKNKLDIKTSVKLDTNMDLKLDNNLIKEMATRDIDNVVKYGITKRFGAPINLDEVIVKDTKNLFTKTTGGKHKSSKKKITIRRKHKRVRKYLSVKNHKK